MGFEEPLILNIVMNVCNTEKISTEQIEQVQLHSQTGRLN